MTKYLKLLMVALFATMSFALTSCGGDDEPNDPNGSTSFNYNGKKLYVRDSGTLDNVQIDGQMQCAFSLYKTADPYSGEELDIYPKVLHEFVKANHPKADTVYDYIIQREVGAYGFNELIKANLIECCGSFDGSKLYAI